MAQCRLDHAHLGRLPLLGRQHSLRPIEPSKKSQLRRALFDEATEPTVEDGSVLGTNMRLETGVIEVLLEDKELTRVVAFGVDGELSIARLRRTFSAGRR